MIRIGILGDIGSGKSYVANNFGYPVFNADNEVSKLYKKNKKIFRKLNKKLPNHILSFPIDKLEVTKAILINKSNLKKIIKIVHDEIRKKMKLFIKKNKNKRIVVLDIPLLLENKINNKSDILVFVESRKEDIEKRIKKRPNFNRRLFNKFKKIQYSKNYKKRKSDFIIKNDFTKKSVKMDIKNILDKIQ
jgi:dephospho-CoA kinase